MTTTASNIRVHHVATIADRAMYEASADYRHSECGEWHSRQTFTGPSHGLGPVLVNIFGEWFPVVDPGRFGDEFNADWVRAYMSA